MLIGRDEELGRLLAALETARDGGSAVIVVRGEAGIGKTALLQAVVAAAEGMTVLRARGVESEVGVPFAALAELCAPVLVLGDRLPEAQAATLAGALALEPVVPQARLAIGAALLGLLSLAAEERPVVCVVDDAQWLDEPSLEALRFATRRLADGGVAVLLARRPDGDAAAEEVETIELGPLAADRAVELLQAGR
ncbi:MAG TPA: ATP-binding protein, partial [Solirubrobacteraceae bacterium]|nr:ATP-binding protein [Solirubrobacteraceae bacterium]